VIVDHRLSPRPGARRADLVSGRERPQACWLKNPQVLTMLDRLETLVFDGPGPNLTNTFLNAKTSGKEADSRRIIWERRSGVFFSQS
jgi:hypothetical protein